MRQEVNYGVLVLNPSISILRANVLSELSYTSSWYRPHCFPLWVDGEQVFWKGVAGSEHGGVSNSLPKAGRWRKLFCGWQNHGVLRSFDQPFAGNRRLFIYGDVIYAGFSDVIHLIDGVAAFRQLKYPFVVSWCVSVYPPANLFCSRRIPFRIYCVWRYGLACIIKNVQNSLTNRFISSGAGFVLFFATVFDLFWLPNQLEPRLCLHVANVFKRYPAELVS